MRPTIVDLSHWQESVDFAKVKAAGILAAILKASEGTSYVDPTFHARRQAAQKAGLAVASYHFLKPGSIGDQVTHYLDTISAASGDRVILDYEDSGLTIADLQDAVNRLLAFRSNLQITVYGGGLLKGQLGSAREPFLAGNTSLWLAHYTSGKPTWPKATWPNYSLWQFTDSATVDGIGGKCDGNVFNGSDANALAFLQPVAAPAPAPDPAPVAAVNVTIELEADRPVNLTVKAGAKVSVLVG